MHWDHEPNAARVGARASWTDTFSGVNHQRGKRPPKAASPELVNNSAAGHSAGGRTSVARAPRPFWTSPTRVSRRSPTPAMTAAPKAERTPPLEGSGISSPGPRQSAPVRAARTMNTNWSEHTHFAALDWAGDHHDICVVDRTGGIAAGFRSHQGRCSIWLEQLSA